MRNYLNAGFDDEPESVDVLMSEPPIPLYSLADELLREGLLLVGGQRRVGNSYILLDLALSVATGRRVWGHFPVHKPQPVLYISLENSRWLLRERLRAMRPDVKNLDNLQFLFEFPRLNKGGLEKLRGHVESGRYRLIVIDPLIRLAAHGDGCRRLFQMLSGLQGLRRQNPVCLAAVMMTTMSGIGRIFDYLPTSDYAPSVLWFLKYGNPVTTLHSRDDHGIFRTLHLHFSGTCLQYCGPEDSLVKPRKRMAS